MALSSAVIDGGLILLGTALLGAGAWLIVESGSAMARRWGMSPLWIGLTVVALGTSLPEFTVTVSAAAQGYTKLAASNVIGSNILNVLIVMGATAAIVSVPVSRSTIRRDLPMVAGAGLLVWFFAMSGTISRLEGVFMVLLVPVYVWFIHRQEVKGYIQPMDAPENFDKLPMAIQWISFFGGLGGLVAGGAALVAGATSLAQAAGVENRVIGLTIVAMGTSLPELATSLMAAFRRKIDMALGNLIGSNVLNLFFVLGTAAIVRPQTTTPNMIWFDFPVMIVSGLLLMRFAATNLRVGRWEGGVMLLLYVGYVAYVLVGPL